MARTGSIARHLSELTAASRGRGLIPLGTMASGMPLGIPYVLLKGRRPGKTLWICGQVHGNEINGIVAALDFVNRLDLAELAGNIVLTPTANPTALDARQKNTPQDGNDLDQHYPGNPNGLFSDRLAGALFEEVRAIAPDLLINMHTQSVQSVSRSYTVFKEHPDGRVPPARLYPLMAAFDPEVACRMNVQPGQGELPGNIAGAIDYQLLAMGIPAFMVELGAAQRARAADVEQGLRGFVDVARLMGMLPGAAVRREHLTRVTRRGHVTVSQGGFFRAHRKPGDIVEAGQAFGEVMDVFGDVVERPVLATRAKIIAIRADPVIHTGDRFGYMAYEWNTVAVEY